MQRFNTAEQRARGDEGNAGQMLSAPPAMGRARGEGGQVPGFSSVARTGCSREITQSTVIHCVDTEVYVALIYLVIFFTLPSPLSLA